VVINLALTGMCTYVSAFDNGLQANVSQRSIYLCTLLHKCMLLVSTWFYFLAVVKVSVWSRL